MASLDPAIVYILSLLLLMIFAVSSSIKLADLESFAVAVSNYKVLPRWLEWPFAVAVPITELVGGLALLAASTRVAGATTLTALLLLFSIAVAINLARGRTDVDCGCFGPVLRQRLSGWLIARNLALGIAAALLVMPTSHRPLLWLDALTCASGAMTLALLYASINYALANAPATAALEAL